MATKKKSEENPKPSKSDYLAQLTIKDAQQVLDHYAIPQRIEMAEHLMRLFMEVEEYFKTGNEDLINNFRKREDELLLKYGREFKPYKEKYFHTFFNTLVLLPEKGYYTTEEYNALENHEKELSQLDVSKWINRVLRYLHGTRYYAYLERDPEFETRELSGTKQEPDKEMTEARRLLTIYYLLKAGFNIEHKSTHSASAVAHLAHLLLGKQFTSLQNSSIYAKYKKMPQYNSGAVLIKDLRYIRQYFEALDIKNALNLIDERIQSTLNELTFDERKKYK